MESTFLGKIMFISRFSPLEMSYDDCHFAPCAPLKRWYSPFLWSDDGIESSNHQTMTRTTALNTLRTTKYTKHTLLCTARFVCSTFLFKQNTKKIHTEISMLFFCCSVTLPVRSSLFGVAWHGIVSNIHPFTISVSLLPLSGVQRLYYYLFLHLLE